MSNQPSKLRRVGAFLLRAGKGVFIFSLRVFLLVSMVFILVCGGVWIAFLRTFNAQHISEVISTEIQTRLGRPVKIESLDLAFINKLELKGFSILDTEGEPGRALVSADSVVLTFNLTALLDNRLIIDEVTLNSPRFNIVRRADRKYNIPQWSVSDKKSVYYTSGSGERLPVYLNNWTIRNGVLSFKDLVANTTHAIYGMNLHFEQLRLKELSRFTVGMVVRNEWEGNISDLEINGAGHVNFANFNWEKFALRSLRLEAFLFQKPVSLLIDMDNIRTPFFNVQADIPAFDSKDLSLFNLEKSDFSVPKSTLNVQGVWTNDYKQIKLSQATWNAEDVKLTASGVFEKQPVGWNVEATGQTEDFKLAGKEKFFPPLASYKLSGTGAVSATVSHTQGKWNWPLVTVTAKDASGEVLTFPVAGASGEFQAKNNFTDLYVKTSTAQVKVDRSTFDKLDLSASWRKGNLYANIASCTLNEEPFKMNLSVEHLKRNNRKIRTNMHWKNLDPLAFIDTVEDFVNVISPLVHAKAGTPPVEGELAWLRNFRNGLPNFMPNFAGSLSADTFSSPVLSGTNFDAEFDFTGLTQGGEKLSGPLRARLEGGVIHQMEKFADEQQAFNVTFQPFIIMNRMERAGSFKVGQVLKDVEFSDLAVSTRFENGKMDIQNAYTVGPVISAAVSGWVDWIAENFDLTIWTMFTNTSRRGVLAENLTDESGDPALAFGVTSSMLKPKVDMLRAKKAGQTIRAAQAKGVETDFKTAEDFIKGEFHAKK